MPKVKCSFCKNKFGKNWIKRHEASCPSRPSNTQPSTTTTDTTNAVAVIPSLSRIYDRGVINEVNKSFDKLVEDTRQRLNELLEEVFG